MIRQAGSRPLNPDSAVEGEVIERGANLPPRRQYVLPLRRRQLSVPGVTHRANRGGEPSVKKDFETEHSGVFASPGLPLDQFLTAESGLNHELALIIGDCRHVAERKFVIARLP